MQQTSFSRERHSDDRTLKKLMTRMEIPQRPFPDGAAQRTPDKDRIEQKTEELILMTGAQGPRRWRQRKGEYLRKLEQDNVELKNLIVELQQQISANQAQKDILRGQLTYFQSCLAQAAPLVFQGSDRAGQPQHH